MERFAVLMILPKKWIMSLPILMALMMYCLVKCYPYEDMDKNCLSWVTDWTCCHANHTK